MNQIELATQSQNHSTFRLWTDAETAWLRENYVFGNVPELSFRLGRSIDGIKRKVWQLSLNGRQHRGQPVTPLEVRFWSKVNKTETCWLWTAGLNGAYGCFAPDGRRKHVKIVLAHRVAYELLVGPIPRGMDLHHKCEVPACVNPDHLEPLTRLKHRAKHPKTHCKFGHEFTVGSFRISSIGAKLCNQCYEDLKQGRKDRRKQKRLGGNQL